MYKKILLSIICLLSALSTYSQCAYTGTPLTSVGTYTFCIDNVNTITTATARSGQYALVNVIQGFRYRFSVGDVFSGNENLTILNATDNSNVGAAGFASGGTGAAIADWTSTISGQIKVLLSRDACINDNTAGGTLSLQFLGGSNTFDNQTAFGTDQWVGHIYNWTGSAPPGGESSPASPATTTPFTTANYVGYYNVASETINENFGNSGTFCFPVLSNGGTRTNIYTETIAIRYRMRSTRPAGCYVLNANGDDGVRVYVDGNLVFSKWRQQGNTTYCNNLINLTGNSVIVFDYYENGGGNIVGFSLTPFDGTSNAITSSQDVRVCSNTSTNIVATDFTCPVVSGVTNGGTTSTYQWQSSLNNTTFTNITTGGTTRNYTAPAVVVAPGAANNVRYFRRVFKPSTLVVGCEFFSNVVTVTTSGSAPAIPGAITGDSSQCRSSTATYSIAPVLNAVSYNWTTTGTGWTITPVANGLSVSVAFSAAATSGNLQVVATNGCGTSTPQVATVTISPVDNTWNGSVWSTALTPTSTLKQRIIFTGNFNQNVDLVGCSCLVTGTSAVTISGNRTLFITNEVEVAVGAVLTFENNASLVQRNNVLNTGKIKYKRETTPIKRFDYTYWSSPVTEQKLFDLSPLTNPGRYYSFNASTATYTPENPQNLMGKGIGYIIRAPENTATPPSPLTPYLGTFEGVPHNGDIVLTPVVAFKAYLIGNPYPSALSADAFIVANDKVLFGTLYFWTHNTARGSGVNNPGTGFFAYSADDYATYNTTGGVAVAASDPDKSITNPYRPTGKIAAGQAFFASTLENMTGTSIVFNNDMRIGAGNTILDNSQFFKTTSGKSKTTSSLEKHRIWLNLTNPQGAFKQMLLGYISGATNNYDTAFDGASFNGNEFVDFYSVNDNKTLTIQGRALPFEENDEIPLGYKSTIEGSFSISIDQVDGLFSSRKVYLEDKIKNSVHDLKQGPYTFETAKGTFNERFVLRYTDKTLGIDDIDTKTSQVFVSVKNKVIKVNSGIEAIDKIYVYTVSGTIIYEKQKVDAVTFSIPSFSAAQQVLIVKTVLQNGSVVTNKIVF